MILSKEILGKRISNARKALGLTQAELSEKVGVSEKYLSRVECGRQVPSVVMVAKICETLNLSADTLLSLNPITTSNNSIHNEISGFSADERKQLVEIIRIIKEIKNNLSFNR